MRGDEDAFARQREVMVERQIVARGVRDAAVLAAMRSVPRHRFVPPALEAEAYADRALPIGGGQTISQPYMVAVMTAALALRAGARVLDVGTGSGYQAAVLARIAAEVITIERKGDLAAEAAARLSALGFRNVRVEVGDGTLGLAASAPYDGILVAAAAPAVPEALRQQLAEGGRLVLPVGSAWSQELLTVIRQRDGFSERHGEGCVFVPLVGEHGWPSD